MKVPDLKSSKKTVVVLPCASAYPVSDVVSELLIVWICKGEIVELVVQIPDAVVATLPSQNGDLARDLLESYALEGYKSGKLTAYQVQELLGLKTRMEADAFLKGHGVPLEVTLAEMEEGRKSLDALLGK